MAQSFKSVEISWETFRRLEQAAASDADTPDSVIARLLDARDRMPDEPAEDEPAQEVQATEPSGGDQVSAPEADEVDATEDVDATADVIVVDPFDPPSLAFSSILQAEVDGRLLNERLWRALLAEIVVVAMRKHRCDLPQLLEICRFRAIKGVRNDGGYTYYPAIGLSIQGQGAVEGWSATASIAKRLGIPVKVSIRWQSKGAHPGKQGLLSIG